MTYQSHLASIIALESCHSPRWFVTFDLDNDSAYARFIEAEGPTTAQTRVKSAFGFHAQMAIAIEHYYSVAVPDASLQNRVLTKQEFQSWESQNQSSTRTPPTSVTAAPAGGITPTQDASKKDS